MRQLGPYKLVSVLGAGGMGQVFRATHVDSGRPVAIKIIKGPQATNPEARLRFVREARAAGQLQHPHIVGVHDVGQVRGSLYIVMEYLRGLPLSSFIPGPPRLSLRRKLAVLTECLEALDYAHSHGVVHRDFKPANVIILQDKSAKLVDFGLAGLASQSNSLVQGGTPPYMSPEQHAHRDPDGRSDIWSVGIALYELLTGRLPFRNVVAIHAAPPPAMPPVIPYALELNTILARALAKDPDKRYARAGDFAADLRTLRQKCERANAADRPHSHPAAAATAATAPDSTVEMTPLLLLAGHDEGASPDTSPSAEIDSTPAHYLMPDLGFQHPPGGELRATAGTLLWAEREKKVRGASHLGRGAFYFHLYAALGVTMLLLFRAPHVSNSAQTWLFLGVLSMVPAWFGLLRLSFAAARRLCSALGVLEHSPLCRGCRLRMTPTVQRTRVCESREEVIFGYRDCMAALKHRLWQEAAKLLSIYGTGQVSRYRGRFISYSARYHIGFFECRLCGHHAARLTADEMLENRWEEQPKFEEAYWGDAVPAPPLRSLTSAAPGIYWRILLRGARNFLQLTAD